MALGINNLFNNVRGNVGEVTDVSKTAGIRGEMPDKSGLRALSDMPVGSSVSGQVVSAEDGNITIRLADNSTVSGELRGAIDIASGDQVTFTIMGNKNNNIVLSPLFTNLNASPNIENALRAAELPVNASSAAMVDSMMHQGMGIDKESVLNMYKNITANPDVDPASVVKLAKMGLEISVSNAETLKQYESLNHQLSGAADQISKDIASALGSLSDGDIESGKELFKALTDIFANGEDKGKVISGSEDGNVIIKGDALGKDTAQAVKEDISLSGRNNEAQGDIKAAAEQIRSGTLPDEAIKAGGGEDTKAVADNISAGGEGNKNISARALLGDDQIKDLMQTLKNAGADDDTLRTLARPTTDASGAMKIINDILNSTDNTALAKSILQHPALSKWVGNAIEDNLLLKPENFADKEKVEEFYEKIRAQGARLLDAAIQTTGKESALSQSTGALNQNLDFMNQLNQAFSYVQIPLKLENQNANGDLYVYANKKSLADKDGNLSAYLHLDLDNLGSVDVYVTMKSDKVSTNFKVADDSVLDLIEEHIGELNERLQKKGYSLNTSVSVKSEDEETSAIEKIEEDAGLKPVAISHLSFDARA